MLAFDSPTRPCDPHRQQYHNQPTPPANCAYWSAYLSRLTTFFDEHELHGSRRISMSAKVLEPGQKLSIEHGAMYSVEKAMKITVTGLRAHASINVQGEAQKGFREQHPTITGKLEITLVPGDTCYMMGVSVSTETVASDTSQ